MSIQRWRGRKKAHPQPLPDIDAVAAVLVFNEAKLRNRWSERRACDEIESAVDVPGIVILDDKEIAKAEFAFDLTTFRKVLNVDLSLNHYHKWAVYLWAKAKFEKELTARTIEEHLRQNETLLHSFNKLLGYDELNVDAAMALVGSYNIYRPFYMDPHRKIFLQRLTVGDGTNVFDCKITGHYETAPGDVIDDLFVGKIVPQGERVAAVLRFPSEAKGSMLVHIDELNLVAGGKRVQTMSGLMITAIGAARSSAWPIFATRVDPASKIEQAVLSREDAKKLPPEVLEAMDRGAVHWKAEHYMHDFRPST